MGKKGKQRDFADLPDYEAEEALASAASTSTAAGGAAAQGDDETAGSKQQAGKKGGSKKKAAKKGAKGCFDSDEEETSVLAVGAGDEEDDAQAVPKQSKAKAAGKKKKQAKSVFELLEEEEEGAPAPVADDDLDEEVPRAKQPGKKGKPGFAALDEDQEEELPAAAEEEAGEQQQGPSTLVIAEILSAQPHPKASDKLKVVEVSVGKGHTYKVVTNALNAKRGMKVVFAPVGVVTSTGIKVDQRTLKGVNSFGMLCQAADIGWTDVLDNKLVVLPDEAVVGHQPPEEPPEELEVPPRRTPAPKLPVAGAAEPEVEEQEVPLPAAKSGKKGKKGKKDTASLFAALEAEGDEAAEQVSAEAPVEEEQQEEGEQAADSKKTKKKKKAAGNAAALFAALADEGDGTAAAQEDGAPVEAEDSGKKKKKKGGKDVDSLFAALAGDGDVAADAVETNGSAAFAEEDMESAAASAGGKKKKKKGGKDVESLFEALAEGTEPLPTPAPVPAATSSSSAAPAAAGLTSSSSSSKKGVKAPKVVDDELDALMAELDAPKPAAPPAAATGGGKKKKKGKGAAKEDEEDLDALLAAIDGPKQPTPSAAAEMSAPGSGPAAAAVAAPAAVPAEGGDDDDDGEGGEDLEALAASGKELTAAQKKKLKKKQKDKEKKAAAKAAEAGGDEGAPAAGGASKGGKPVKESAMARRIREELERRQRAEEEARQAEEARRAAELEEIRQQEEEEARRAEEKRLKKEREKAKREQLKREGKLLTGKAKAEAERLAAMRAQLLKQAEEKGIELPPAVSMDSQAAADAKSAAEAAAAADAAGEKKPKKVVYTSKKQMQKKKEEDKSKEEQEEEERVRREAEEEAARKAKEEEETAAAAKAAAAAAASQQEEEEADDWEGAADDWEALDLDTVKAPVGAPTTQEPAAAPHESDKPAAAAAPGTGKAQPAVAVSKPPPSKQAAEDKNKASAKTEGSDEEEEEEEEESDDEASSDEASGSESDSGSDDEEESDDDSGSEDSESEEESEEEESEEEEEDSSDEDDGSMDSEERREMRIEEARERRLARAAAARKTSNKEELRSPICCILGHVDVGKTKILDNIRRTNVQDGEAGGITQQIGATFVPADAIERRTEQLRGGRSFDMKLPGLLVIDTPGHESFTNLRARGSGLCDIAVLIVDLMHGLEQQTIESINLLKMRKTPFIIALNKIDRLYGWKSAPDAPVRDSFKRQKEFVMTEFEQRSSQVFLQLNEQGLNVSLYWKNSDPRKYVNVVPTSAITGEGIPDLLQLMVKLTQTMMGDRLMFVDNTECTVLEVKTMEGLGTTVDCVLVNGRLKEGDRIVVCGLAGPIITRIKALKTPQVLREMRVKGALMDHKEIRAAMGVKVVAPGLEQAVAGTSMYVVGPKDDEEELKDAVMEDMADIFSKVDKGGEGVCVQASTLGSLEALLTFLDSDDVKIPVSGINIGPVHKKDVLRANVMNEKHAKKYAVILAFDVPVAKEAKELAEEFGVRIFTADIIYHLFDQFTAYVKQFKQQEQEAASLVAIFPCVLKILDTCIFNKRDPIVLGVEVVEGIAKVGTPICVPSKDGMDLGRIASLELNHKAVDTARAGQSVAMKIEAGNSTEQSRAYGRHFDFHDELVSHITRESIDALKAHFKEDMTKDDWRLVVKLKKLFKID